MRATPQRVEVDPDRIRQAVLNLADNALRHGQGDIVVTGDVVREGLLVDVHDQGIGFTEGLGAAAFEPFRRRQPTSRASGGAGLGLTIVKAAAEAHGGTVTAYRDDGGAGVRLLVPLTNVAEARPAAARPGPRTSRGSAPTSGCHWTPTRHRAPGASIASSTPSSAHAVALVAGMAGDALVVVRRDRRPAPRAPRRSREPRRQSGRRARRTAPVPASARRGRAGPAGAARARRRRRPPSPASRGRCPAAAGRRATAASTSATSASSRSGRGACSTGVRRLRRSGPGRRPRRRPRPARPGTSTRSRVGVRASSSRSGRHEQHPGAGRPQGVDVGRGHQHRRDVAPDPPGRGLGVAGQADQRCVAGRVLTAA